jgi:hypothetical protein
MKTKTPSVVVRVTGSSYDVLARLSCQWHLSIGKTAAVILKWVHEQRDWPQATERSYVVGWLASTSIRIPQDEAWPELFSAFRPKVRPLATALNFALSTINDYSPMDLIACGVSPGMRLKRTRGQEPERYQVTISPRDSYKLREVCQKWELKVPDLIRMLIHRGLKAEGHPVADLPPDAPGVTFVADLCPELISAEKAAWY